MHVLMRRNLKKKVLFLFGIILLLIFCLLYYSQVDSSLTEEDKQYIPKYLDGVEALPENASYEDEIRFITEVQRIVRRKVARRSRGIPISQKREPKELFISRSGLCYDRSRVIEKILRFNGFTTRHVSIFYHDGSNSGVNSLSVIFTGKSSHAISEVLTKNGWLVVDSNNLWISISNNNVPVSIENIQSANRSRVAINWRKKPPFGSYQKPFVIVYGLYSRHGRFYPPYNSIPDIDYSEFIQNLF